MSKVTTQPSAREALQRVIFPKEHDPDLLPLYVDADFWGTVPVYEDAGTKAGQRGFIHDATDSAVVRLTERGVVSSIEGERGFSVPQESRVSFGTYFNAFPASYWQKWSTVQSVELSVDTRGTGLVIVYRSNARGVVQRVSSRAVSGEQSTTFDLDLTLFGDGGWYWFDLVAEHEEFALVEANWFAGESTATPTAPSASVAITTFNRGTYCLQLIRDIFANTTVVNNLDAVYVIDQGTEKLSELEGFADVAAASGGKLVVIEQANLGGSGGFSRGMHETVTAGNSDFVLLLDDDIAIEAESILRALKFAQYQAQRTIVGGHMFDMYDRSKLHAFAEGFTGWNFMWGSLSPNRHDFAQSNLRQTKWLHRRIDSEYNGWWMSLIPVSLVKEMGYSLPMFIKWDDAEFALRARDHGVKTVSLPGAAVWHVSWVDKDDTQDWQAFFHARNRLVAALLHSRHAKGGGLGRHNFAIDFKHLLSMQYFAVAARLDAYKSVLDGPEGLHEDIRTRMPRVRQLAAAHPETMPIRDRSTAPRLVLESGISEMKRFSRYAPRGRGLGTWLVKTALSHAFGRSSANDDREPELHLAFEDARWWVVPNFRSVLVSNAEGSAMHWHRRDPRLFRSLLWRSITSYFTLRRRWATLRRDYRQALPTLASAEEWQKTFAAGGQAK